MTDILVIPDSHAKPGASNERFTWLGNLAADRKPDVIVHLGDLYDMESLCSYDKGKADFARRSYRDDIDAGDEAVELLMEPVRRTKKKLPLRIFTEGNHEERYHRLLSYEPQLRGELRQPAPQGWQYIPYLEPAIVNGVAFQHYFVSGVMGRAISGEHPAANICRKHMISTVSGHSHLLDFAERTRSDGQRVQALVAGCFLAENQEESYAKAVQHMWHNMVVYLHGVRDGSYDHEVISYDRLKKEYK